MDGMALVNPAKKKQANNQGSLVHCSSSLRLRALDVCQKTDSNENGESHKYYLKQNKLSKQNKN